MIRQVRIGDHITVTQKEQITMHRWEEAERRYRVTKIYPYHVLCEDTESGLRRSFSYGDLIALGIEHQTPEKEALKIFGGQQARGSV